MKQSETPIYGEDHILFAEFSLSFLQNYLSLLLLQFPRSAADFSHVEGAGVADGLLVGLADPVHDIVHSGFVHDGHGAAAEAGAGHAGSQDAL